ncbi:serine/threonine protein kinase [Lysobacter sp. H21R4]|uniref:serine/threonine-protein kinase n=1 Tax=Lysobacter sp. H21R4 TaxID=2781021 RepID=UPI0018892C1A|nr:serine/threonine-protein kinase [Lysobacter sp. H21R4]QOY63118.1 serine/threonine protein kinase [Lysobacter sp. H21R4]
MQDAKRLQRVWELFDLLAERAPEVRSAELETLEADPAIRAEVQALLRDADTHTVDTDALRSPPPPLLAPGTRIGHWEIEHLIGRGGMGEVYMAHRFGGDFEQRAALKLLMRMDSAQDRAGFVAERQILARLEHPGIAHLLDGGEVNGVPYAVMEYVEGVPLTRAPDLGLERKLALVLQACDAVSHAHQHLVIHRDLKPGNMLVTPEGRLKLLDFGIAKHLAPAAERDSEPAASGHASPDYCAPEQLTGAPVSTATDVYSLGVILYELLTQHRPWQLTGAAQIRALERLSQPAPQPPSTRVEGRMRKALRGDLDAIVLKALQTDPAQRYRTVAELASDLRAHLGRHPVAARRQTLGYRLGCRIRRHRVAYALAAAVFASLALGLVGVAWQGRQATIERDHARRQAVRNDAVRQYLTLMFRTASGTQEHDEVTAKSVLDGAAKRVHDEFAGDPESYADVALALAELYFQINDYTGARPLLVRLLRDDAGVAEHVRAMAMHDLAQVSFRESQTDQARDLLDQAQKFWNAEPATYRAELLDSRLLQSQIQRALGDPGLALRTLEEALPQRVELSGLQHRDTAVLINNLGLAYYQIGQLDDAIVQLKRAHAIWQTLGQENSSDALNTLNNWASAAVQSGRREEAAEIYSRTLELRRKLYGPSGALAALMNNLGKTLSQLDRHEEAVPLLREAIAMGHEHAGGETGTIALAAGLGLVDALAGIGEVAPAREKLDSLAPAIMATFGSEHPFAAMLEISRARVERAEGNADAASAALGLARQRLQAMGPAGAAYLAQLETLQEQWRE